MKPIITEGQISIFDLPKEEIKSTKAMREPVLNFDKIINQYKDTCNRIFMIEKDLYVELEDRTVQFHKDGEQVRIFDIDMLVRPKDELIISNKYKSINDKQIKTLRKIQTDKFIKRKSDSNILIQYDNFCMAIYPSGHFAKWKSEAVFKENEVYTIDEIENINKMHEEIKEDPKVEGVTEISESEETLRLGDKVKFDYHGPKEGNIVRIYNKGETVNVSWDNKQTAFYYKSVVKINA